MKKLLLLLFVAYSFVATAQKTQPTKQEIDRQLKFYDLSYLSKRFTSEEDKKAQKEIFLTNALRATEDKKLAVSDSIYNVLLSMYPNDSITLTQQAKSYWRLANKGGVCWIYNKSILATDKLIKIYPNSVINILLNSTAKVDCSNSLMNGLDASKTEKISQLSVFETQKKILEENIVKLDKEENTNFYNYVNQCILNCDSMIKKIKFGM